jgi:hypothetical protein
MLQDHASTIYLSGPAHSLLASVYASLGLYARSRTSLHDLLLLAPNDAFTVLR